MQLRGAPAIGVAGAYAVALAARAEDEASFPSRERVREIAETVRTARPTAVNLTWAVDRMLGVLENFEGDGAELAAALLDEAHLMADEDVAINRRMGACGAELIADGSVVLTHCNAGSLATVQYGTALGVIYAAHEQGKRVHVFVDETRPFLQGARLTAWELQEAGIPYTLITDNMAGYYLKNDIDLVITGADRIASNGDVANKIGTYGLAVIAHENSVPFYVAAPFSTFDLALASGDEIPIEQRSPAEVTSLRGVQIAPDGANAAHPAFDVTPARYIAGIITEYGVLRPPFQESFAKITDGRKGQVE